MIVGRCDKHAFEASHDLCNDCGREFCPECLAYPFGPKRAPICVDCALTKSGVRKNAARGKLRSRREIRKERKLLRKRREERADEVGVTMTLDDLPIKVALINNAYLGMVRQWQEMFYDEKYSEVFLNGSVPDFVMWAESMGAVGIRVESPEEVGPAIEKANAITDRSVVIEFRCDPSEKVFPMVPAGVSNDELILHPQHAGDAHHLRRPENR